MEEHQAPASPLSLDEYTRTCGVATARALRVFLRVTPETEKPRAEWDRLVADYKNRRVSVA